MYKKGFTLIELLVVIAIIGTLASVVLASLNTARTKAHDAKRVAEIAQLALALELYYDENGNYPYIGWADSSGVGSYGTNWNTLQTSLAPYISRLPTDPVNTGPNYVMTYGSYSYSYYSGGYRSPGQTDQQWYMLVYKLENQNLQKDTITNYDCAGNGRNYGGVDGYVMMAGQSCI